MKDKEKEKKLSKDRNMKGSVKEGERGNKRLINNKVKFEQPNPKTLFTLLEENKGGTPRENILT